MPNKLTARQHWDKAFDYFWKGDRRRTIKEARLTLNPVKETYRKAVYLEIPNSVRYL